MPPPEPDRDELLNWVEHVATFFAERFGLPPITGRILGWLMVCDPPEQSAGEIAKAIGASRASLTTNMRMLTVSSLVRRRSRPGGRTTYFRIDDDAWEKVSRQRIASMAAGRSPPCSSVVARSTKSSTRCRRAVGRCR